MSLEIGHSWIQHAIKLARNAKYRRKQLKTIVSSPKIISELPESVKVHRFAITPEFLKSDKISKFNRIENLMKNTNHFEISLDIAKSVTREASPEGIIAEVDTVKITTFPISSVEKILMLYKISDPGNLGTLIRTAMAFEWNRVILIDDCVDPFNPETIRSSMGANFKTKLQYMKSGELNNFVQNYGINLLIADNNDKHKDLNYRETLRRPLALLLGSEANGFKGFPKEIYDSYPKICVKMSNDSDSLNIAVCGGILMNNLR